MMTKWISGFGVLIETFRKVRGNQPTIDRCDEIIVEALWWPGESSRLGISLYSGKPVDEDSPLSPSMKKAHYWDISPTKIVVVRGNYPVIVYDRQWIMWWVTLSHHALTCSLPHQCKLNRYPQIEITYNYQMKWK